MSRPSNPTDDDAVQAFLSVADLLEDPQLARLYAYLDREGPATVADVVEALDVPQGTAYDRVNELVDAGVLEPTTDGRPQQYAASEIDLTVTAADDGPAASISSALIDAVGRRATNDDIDAFADRQGVGGLAVALEHAVARERGEVTHRSVAQDLECSPLAAELLLQALRPVVHEHFDVEAAGASVDDLDAIDPPADGAGDS